MTQQVYFMRPIGMDGPIKIGCSRVPAHRLLQLNTWAAFPLEIIFTLPGGPDLEKRFHARLAAAWSHSEWFHATPDTLKVVSDAQAGVLPEEDGTSPCWQTDARRHAYRRMGMSMRLNAAKKHAFGYVGHRVNLPEEAVLKVASDGQRDLTPRERAELDAAICRLKALPRSAIFTWREWNDAGQPEPMCDGIADVLAIARAA